MNRILIAAALTVVAVGGGWFAVSMQARAAARAEVDRLVREVRLEVEQPEPERAELIRLRQALDDALDSGRYDAAPLLRARARLLFALGGEDRTAWNDLAGLFGPSSRPNPDDQLLGARILARVHLSVDGRAEDGRQALGLLQDSDLARPLTAAADLELGWLLGFRVGDIDAWTRFGDRLRADVPSSPEGRLATGIDALLAAQLAQRAGLNIDRETLEQAASNAEFDEPTRALAQTTLDTLEATVTVSELERVIEARTTTVPPEADFAIGFLRAKPELVKDAAARDAGAVGRAREEVTLALRNAPRLVAARHAMMVLELADGRLDRAGKQAKWLVKNGPAADVRQRVWQNIRDTADRATATGN
jgi:hypothetical protein